MEQALTDEETVARFVVWRIRARDLPPDVAAAARRLARLDRYDDPAMHGDPLGYLEASFSVVGVDGVGNDETAPPPTRRCFGRDDALQAAGELVDAGIPYVLVQALPAIGAADDPSSASPRLR